MQGVRASTDAVAAGRYRFIDFTRGVVMIIMAWDHIAGFWTRYHSGKTLIGKAPFPTVLVWYMSRFITHYCAPTFIFIAGTSLAISATKRLSHGEPRRDVSLRMVKRGVVLILLQLLIINPAWEIYGNHPSSFLFAILACIGACLIIFSLLWRLPQKAVLALSLLIILNHPFLKLNWIPDDIWWGHYLRVIIHEPGYDWWPFTGRYPIIPWLGVMGLGWVFGLLLVEVKPSQIHALKVPLTVVGVASSALFLVVRLFNGYGNLRPRVDNSLWEWLWLAKYPPSLAFLLWTLGGMCIIMAVGLHLEGRVGYGWGLTGFTLTLGRNPLFFYVVHLWLYRFRLPLTSPPNFRLPIVPTLIFWLAGLFVLWRLCIRYEAVKGRYPNSILQYV